jgi:hypothetical protein
LKKKLPIPLSPSAFIFLEAFPLTSGGKLHLQALPVPEQAHRLQVTDFLPPQTALEELIAEMWREDLLNVDQFDLHDNFFELGGHSLLVTQVICVFERS